MAFQYSAPNVLNLFTDASTYKNVSCSAYSVVQQRVKVFDDFMIFREVTNNFGELYAIMMALTYLYRWVYTKRATGYGQEVDSTFYNLFSDSMYALDCLRSWVPGWVGASQQFVADGVPPNTLMKRKMKFHKGKYLPDGEKFTPVQNSDVILHCVWMILAMKVPIKFMHIKAHTNIENPFKLVHAVNDFSESNKKVKVNIKETLKTSDIIELLQWNKDIDKKANNGIKQIFASNTANELPVPSNWPIYPFPTPQQMKEYKRYIR